MRRKALSKEEVIEKITERAENKLPLNHRSIVVDDQRLLYGATKHFGTWDNALIASGIDITEVKYVGASQMPKGYWTKTTVLEHISEAHRSGKSLLPSNVDDRLYRATLNFFNTWSDALNEIGIDISDYDRYRKRKQWSKEKIISTIVQMHNSGIDISRSNIRKINPKLYNISKYYFKSWKNAIKEAGLTEISAVHLKRNKTLVSKEEAVEFFKSSDKEVLIEGISKMSLTEVRSLYNKVNGK